MFSMFHFLLYMYNGIAAKCLRRFVDGFTTINSYRISYIYISIKYTRGIFIVSHYVAFHATARFATDVIILAGAFLIVSFSSLNELLDRIYCPVCFCRRWISRYPLPRIISSISTLCQVITLLQRVNVVCPETRVKGLAPTDSFRFLAFILLL